MNLIDLLCGALILVVLSPLFLILISELRSKREEVKEEHKEKMEKLKNKVYGPDITSKSKKPSIYREEYETVEHLMEMFTAKREEAKTLIEVVFPSPQLTNSKFVDDIEEIDRDFFKVYNSLNLFFSFYPTEDKRSFNIISNEAEKLTVLYNRLINIIAELSILVLNEDCDINPDDVKESSEQDTDNISMYSKSDNFPTEKVVKETLDEALKKTGTLKDSFQTRDSKDNFSKELLLKRNSFGWSPISKKCKICQHFVFMGESKHGMCLHWHSHPIPEMDACSDFVLDHGD